MIRLNNSKMFLAVALMALHGTVTMADDVFVRLGADGTGDGSSWETALNQTQFAEQFATAEAGTAFYLSEGTYELSATLARTSSFTLRGGYPATLTGTDTTQPQAVARTVLKGDGNVAQLLSINMTGLTNAVKSNPVIVENIDFTNANATSTASNGDFGALYACEAYNMTVSCCDFYGNTSGYGGAASRLAGSNVVFRDCAFHDNEAQSRGAAMWISNGSTTKGFTTLERCAIYGNTVTANYGSAVFVQQTNTLSIINSAIYGNTAYSGAAVYLAGSTSQYPNKAVIISSTIAGNNHIQVQQAGAMNVMMANSVVCCPTDTEDSSNSGFFWTGTTTFVSGGNNIIGSAAVDKNNNPDESLTLLESDSQTKENTFSAVFGTSTIDAETIRTPQSDAGGMTVAALQALAANDDWNPANGVTLPIDLRGDLRVDLNGTMRRGELPGAFDPLTRDVTIADMGMDDGLAYATFYTDYSYAMPDGVTGAIITSTDNRSIGFSYIFAPGDVVPAETALLWKGMPGTCTLNMLPPVEAGDETAGNILRGSEEQAMTTSDLPEPRYYKLADGSNGFGFYWGADDGAAFLNAANKAYFALDNSIGSAAKYFSFGSMDETSAITSPVAGAEAAADWYTLQGTRLSGKPVRRGIYINNGKKVVIK